MDKIISCEEKIYIFDNNTFWGDKKYKNFISSDITLAGKYIWNASPTIFKRKENSKNKSNDTDIIYYLEELEDVNGNRITLVIPKDLRPEEESKTHYEITGKLITHPDNYSYKIKLYAQLLVEDIKEISVNASYYVEMNQIIELRKKLLDSREKIPKQKVEDLSQKLIANKKINFLVIASYPKVNQYCTSDILNDVYENNAPNKENMKKYFGFFTEGKENINIIRTTFAKKEKIIFDIKSKIEESEIAYDYLVFIKGGGSNMSIFDDTEFCEEVVNFKIPLITAVGHKDDSGRLLCQLADIDFPVPNNLGVNLIKAITDLEKAALAQELKEKKEFPPSPKFDDFKTQINNLKKEKEELERQLDFINQINTQKDSTIKKHGAEIINLKEKIKNLEKNISFTNKINAEKDLTIDKNKIEINNYKDKIDDLSNNINMKKFKLYISLIVIIILIGYVIYATFFINTKDIKKPNPEITSTKVKKEEINNSIASKPKQNEKTKIDNSKKAPTKKLQYSEDEVFTKLLWKGYKGEKAIYDFQKANGMPSTGKVDEALLKKLEIKVKYQ
ncbi:exodeoxyribonuclease VII large subunit [Fusobacterium ulcerans]|uniref:exodeoxyribonuclease VII large subunit n=1 Tax=Fusobacterium ulcerans TaxID=861 RepID=UPI001D0A8E0C|nr:exodeoxyribonuclease VII large subunit [Fusobacterium ulcerans]MCB8564498.1 hypothetical protein [Fusobacterium ulcerans]MCB8648669.1 hypothetical protein [Fusobacterium ulcerans]